ncbi:MULTISPECIES: hypothetical protein [unclassified Aureimonas]|uniref:hypothetical protein n=1 Tax=unclassified Aureimonas TaxID=2615206 RepID=UPI0006FC16DE|nr:MULTISPECIES: hypothetical protein [unclassified Aureimonas]KQT66180.1 hypothetical protein ASG62_19265 [Aureimonas sp. Leaf427]KQT72368.1 hypothetical protein ASG54_03635 [Aureimonas sp. Leaf460]
MRFATIALATGLVGSFFASNLQGSLSSSVAEAAPMLAANALTSDDLDAVETGSIGSATGTRPDGLRLIDLRSGTTCKADGAGSAGATFTDVPLGRDCKTSPSLSRIAQWRSGADGTLVMADRDGATILEFAPGDGVLYESVYPNDELITIVPARG